ncbi:YfiR family protein [Pigmentiphaga aceris]|uniref:YfiR family protein n=1 Tax=Pigmentiphaga aceris TaxID=1940612 RepID=UPI001FEB6C2A|nr:YfiR family protein [Pigmentiphaga aceris]
MFLISFLLSLQPSLLRRRLASVHRRCLLGISILAISLCATNARAQDIALVQPSLIEQQTAAVKDVVLGLLSYVRWPTEPAGIQLCVVGPTSYADGVMRGMVQATGRKVLAQRLSFDDARLGERCNAVYLGLLTDAERLALFHALEGHAVLSISERDLGCSVGSVFCLNVGTPRVSFEVNLDSMARSGLRVHPSVLQLAKRSARP